MPLGVRDDVRAERNPTIVVVGGAELFEPLERELGSVCRVIWAPHEHEHGVALTADVAVAVLDVGLSSGQTCSVPLELALKLIRIRSGDASLQLVFLLDRASLEPLLRANRSSSLDFVVKPAEPDELPFRVRGALARIADQRWAMHLEAALESLRLAARARTPPLAATAPGPAQVDYREAMRLAHEQAARNYLSSLMGDVNGNVARAAKRAGLERESLHRLLRRYGIRSETFKPG